MFMMHIEQGPLGFWEWGPGSILLPASDGFSRDLATFKQGFKTISRSMRWWKIKPERRAPSCG